MANDETTPAGGEQKPAAPAAAAPAAPAPAVAPAPAAGAPAAAPAKKKSGVIAVLALIFGAVAVIFALIPFVVFVAPFFGLTALILAIVALVKKSGHLAVRIISLVLAVIAAPLAAIGLFGTFLFVPPTLDGKVVSTEVETKLYENYATTATVECDDTMSGWPGTTFECPVTAKSGNVGSVLITMEDGGEWSVNIEDPAFFTILSTEDVQDAVASEIYNNYGVGTYVTCPEEMFGGIDTYFTCSVEADDGSTGEVEITITGGSSDDWVWELVD